MIYDHSQLINNIEDESHKLYGFKKSDKSLDFAPYDSTEVAKKYKNYLATFRQDYDDSTAISKSNEKIITFLRDEWHRGLKNIKAQTRIASSYGLLQMLYTTALGCRYPEERQNLPENLNITFVFMELSMYHQKSLLRTYLGSVREESCNWPDGFEASFKYGVYKGWNSKKWYINGVMRKVLHYKPQYQ
jgi:hypothetical protein